MAKRKNDQVKDKIVYPVRHIILRNEPEQANLFTQSQLLLKIHHVYLLS